MEPLYSPSVAIDGEAVRRIREEKRLTQLYVSKVVGVTTDTVSRWENNRYPTIRRDNALKLAEALEVTLSDILKQNPIAEESAEKNHLKKTQGKNRIYFFVLAGIILIVLFFLLPQFNLSSAPVLKASRLLPPYAAPGSRILIRVELVAKKPLKGMILKEKFPQGWHLIESEPAVSGLDPTTGIARWIFRNPALKTRVLYILEVATDAHPDSAPAIDGELIANPDGQHSGVSLKSIGTMQVKPFHWADKNGDRIIDDMEILELSDLMEETGPLQLDWDLIETIWEVGAYQWQADKKQFVPVQPSSDMIK
jgi:transcriptional regulator with XRE-family HTH domain